jgi:hypothetical protein
VINHISVSRRHAVISVREETIAIADLRSRNGTFVDDQRMKTARIVCGQRLRFGEVSFLVKDDSVETDSDLNTDVCDLGQLGPPVETIFAPAQKRVLEMVLEGRCEKEITRGLHLSPHTVHNHLQAIYCPARGPLATGIAGTTPAQCRSLSVAILTELPRPTIGETMRLVSSSSQGAPTSKSGRDVLFDAREQGKWLTRAKR